MDNRIKNIEEMTDSRILFEKKVPAFGYFLISIVTILLVCIVVWSMRSPKTSVIKSAGLVQSKEKNYVMAPYSGEILSFDVEEGEVVKQGDILFTLSSVELDAQEKQLLDQKILLENQKEMYNKLEKSIKDNENYFSATIENEQLYYNMFESYIREIEQMSIDVEMLKTYGYTQDQIEEEIKKNDTKIEQRYYTELQNVENKITEIDNQLKTAESQLEVVDEGKEGYSVKANASGKIHLLGQFNVGMVMQAGTSVASIASNSDEFEIYVSVGDSDVVRIEKGDKVDISVNGLNQSVYGTISGKVVSKDSDITISNTEKGTTAYFNIKIEPDYNYVIDKNGEKFNLSNGMSVETRIQYDKITYFEYALDALGIKL